MVREITPDGQVAMTRQNQDAADADQVNGIIDLVEAGSIVAIAVADDAYYNYYLLKVISRTWAHIKAKWFQKLKNNEI